MKKILLGDDMLSVLIRAEGNDKVVFELETGWHGPVVSGFGLHLVNVTDRVESRLPEYDEVRDRLVK